MVYNQGDIVLIPFPYSDLSANEQRPALIISNYLVNKAEDMICCLVTKNFRKEDLLIKEEDFKSGTLPFSSFHNKIIAKLNEYITKL